MIGQDDAYLVSVGQVHCLTYHIVPREKLQIHQMYMAGADGPFCQGAVRGQGSRQMAALPLGTEGKEQGNVFQGRLQAGKDLVQGVRLQYGIKPVRSPFSYIHWLPCEGCCPMNQGFVIRFHQGGAYFRHSLSKYSLFYNHIFHDKEHLSCNLFEFVWIHYKAGRGFVHTVMKKEQSPCDSYFLRLKYMKRLRRYVKKERMGNPDEMPLL